MKNKNNYLIPIIALVLLTVGVFVYKSNATIFRCEEEGEFGGLIGPVRDIVGSRTAPTTTPAYYYREGGTIVASSSKIVKLLEGTDSLLFNVITPYASTSNMFSWRILGSNDNNCDTTATTTGGEAWNTYGVAIKDINWHEFDITSSYDNYQVSDSPATYGYENATGTSFILTNNIWGCAKIITNGSSTGALMQMKEKTLTSPF